MNWFYREFRKCTLKASLMIEKDLKKLLKEASAADKEGINIAQGRIKKIQEEIKTLHENSLIKIKRN